MSMHAGLPVRVQPELPQELIDDIIAQVMAEETWTATLKTCSLVSKSFYFSCRSHLLSSISFMLDKNPQKQAQRFLRIFTRHPRNIAQIIRSFSLVRGPSSEEEDKDTGAVPQRLAGAGKNLLTALRPWDNAFSDVLEILRRTPFHTMTIAGTADQPLEFSEIPYPKKLVDFLSSRSLELLRISHATDIPTSFIASVVYTGTMKQLSLYKVIISDRLQLTGFPYRGQSSAIEKLDLRLETDFAYRSFLMSLIETMGGAFILNPTNIFPQLTVLTIRIPKENSLLTFYWDCCTPFIQPQLQELHMILDHHGPVRTHGNPYLPFKISKLTALRRLRVTLHVESSIENSFENKMIELAAFLTSTKSSSPTEIFTLKIVVGQPSDSIESHSGPSEQIDRLFGSSSSLTGWREMDAALTNPTKFANLQSVDIVLELVHSRLEGEGTVRYSSEDMEDIVPLISSTPGIELAVHVSLLTTRICIQQ